MKLLLDTHAFIWWDSAPNKLSETALALIQDNENTVSLSVVSAWEIQIKSQLGKLSLASPLKDIISAQQSANDFEILPVELKHTFALDSLPMHHKDPFDRLLIAQAIAENATLVSRDSVFSQYSVSVVW